MNGVPHPRTMEPGLQIRVSYPPTFQLLLVLKIKNLAAKTLSLICRCLSVPIIEDDAPGSLPLSVKLPFAPVFRPVQVCRAGVDSR